MIVEIETPSGVYKILKPKGRIGARWIALLMGFDLPVDEQSWQHLTATQRVEVSKALAILFETFTTEILPKIFKDGPHKPEDIPPEDMAIILATLMQDAAKVKDLKFPGIDTRDIRNLSTTQPEETE